MCLSAKWNHCYQPVVDNFPITAHHKVVYSSYVTAIRQHEQFIVTFNVGPNELVSVITYIAVACSSFKQSFPQQPLRISLLKLIRENTHQETAKLPFLAQ